MILSLLIHIIVLLLFSCYVTSDSVWPPWKVAWQASLSLRFSRQEYWSWLPFPSPGNLPISGIEHLFHALKVGFFTTESSGKPSNYKLGIIKDWCWERLKAGGEGDDRGCDVWMASPMQWTWVWVNSGRRWKTGKPGVLQSMGPQRVRHNWATEQQIRNKDILEYIYSPALSFHIFSLERL